MADALDISSRASTPLDMADERAPASPDAPSRHKARQRLLRGIQRISSSPSLAHLGRSRSLSNPYRARGSLSCVSLANPPVAVPPGSDSYFPPQPSGSAHASAYASASSSIPGTPASEAPYFDGIETRMAVVRKIDPDTTTPRTPGAAQSIPLPADLVFSSKLKAPVSKIQLVTNPAIPKPNFDFWKNMPHEIRIHIFSYLLPKELVRVSRVSHMFHSVCLDGQLWTCFDASEFHQHIPAESLAKIVVAAGPFIKDLNLRGCVQVEHYKRAELVVKACENLINATLEGCRNFQRSTLHNLVRSNTMLANLNLTGLTAVTNTTCKIIAESCPQLQMFNVSWCTKMDARGIGAVLDGCPMLTDLRAGEIKGFDNMDVGEAVFRATGLQRLVLGGCADLTDRALKAMVQGIDPEVDILTSRPVVPARRWRHLDLSRCSHITNHGVRTLGHLVPDLEGLQLSGCTALTDAALEPILASAPRLTHLELEELSELTNNLLSEHLAKAPCAPILEHLSVSYCENLGDTGMLPVVKNCVRLKSIDLDNTRISDLVLAEAAFMVVNRSERTMDPKSKPKVGLHMVVYDCQNVTWTGIREVLFRNAQTKQSAAENGKFTYPSEIISLKCFYGFQMTVDEHVKRVLRGDLGAASRLERKWADYMQASEEAGATGAGIRRRRRRAREAQLLHADEEEGGTGNGGGRRRARTVAACVVM